MPLGRGADGEETEGQRSDSARLSLVPLGFYHMNHSTDDQVDTTCAQKKRAVITETNEVKGDVS